MKTALAEIRGISSILLNRARFDVPERAGESVEAYETRTWRERLHYDPVTKECFIPGTKFKRALDWAASNAGSANDKLFKSGVICPDPMMLGITRDQVDSIILGRRRYPILHEWGGTVEFIILNETISEDIFQLHLSHAGRFCGLGMYAPRAGGLHGKFEVLRTVLLAM